MSIKVMALVWERDDLDPYERLVMLSLADHADDEGQCYPSIDRLCKRTGMKARGVQNVLRRLTEKGLVFVAQNKGRGGANLYTLRAETPAFNAPRTECTPAPGAPLPPHSMHPTPAPGAPKPSRTVKEPSLTPLTPHAVLCRVLRGETATAFEEHRRGLRKDLTLNAATLIAKKLAEVPDPDAVVEMSIMNGWTGVFPERGKRNEQSGSDFARSVASEWRGERMDSGQDSNAVVALLPTKSQ